MATRLDKTLKRSLRVKGEEFLLAVSPKCLKIVRKGHRKGLELNWAELVSGDAALAVALNASLEKLIATPAAPGKKDKPRSAATPPAAVNTLAASRRRATVRNSTP